MVKEKERELEKEQIWEYLTSKPHNPIYVIENKNIILSLTFDNEKTKVHSEVYVPGTDNTVSRDVDVEFLKTINYWKPTHRFYTSIGMKVLLDTWEKEEAVPRKQ